MYSRLLLAGMLILGVPGVAAAADRYEGKYPRRRR